jgi:ELWxxDGT repeat protein
VKDINPGLPYSVTWDDTPVVMNGKVYFLAEDETHGIELWTSDGTGAGTHLVKDIDPGIVTPQIQSLTVAGNNIFFVANDGAHGHELWVSDGTDVGTHLVKDIYPNLGDALINNQDTLCAVSNKLFFTANDGVHGNELWVSDGSDAGTALVKDIQSGASDSGQSQLVNVNGTLFFIAYDLINGYQLWKSNGTEAGTVALKQLKF